MNLMWTTGLFITSSWSIEDNVYLPSTFQFERPEKSQVKRLESNLSVRREGHDSPSWGNIPQIFYRDGCKAEIETVVITQWHQRSAVAAEML